MCSVTSAYSSTSLPATLRCPSSSHPTTLEPGLRYGSKLRFPILRTYYAHPIRQCKTNILAGRRIILRAVKFDTFSAAACCAWGKARDEGGGTRDKGREISLSPHSS